jgi:hypothetical protein
MMKNIEINLEGLNVMLGMPAGRDLHGLTVKSMIGTQAMLYEARVPFQLGMVLGSSVIQWARDEVVDIFLKSSATRLFWIDSDMVWEPEQFMRLLALSQRMDVVCAAYPAKVEQPTFYLNHEQQMEQNEYGMLEIKGVGLGFTVMSRKVVEELAANAPRIFDEAGNRDMAAVFRVDSIDGKRRGEDMAFFSDIRNLGYKVWLDPEIDLGHVGQKVYRGTIRDALQLTKEV